MSHYNYTSTERTPSSFVTSPSLSELPLAMAYVPWQHFTGMYDLDEGLHYGTIFPELNKPFLGSKGGKCNDVCN